MSNSPENNSEGLISCKIYSEGSTINDSFGIVSIWIRKEVNRIGFAQITFEAGNLPKQEVPESEDETFAPGKTIRIEAGYKNSEKVVFEGLITCHSIQVNESEDKLVIECRDFSYPLSLSRKNKIFEGKKDNEIIQELLTEYPKITATVSNTSVKHNELVQYYCSDWDFILSRASLNGMLVITEGKNISINPPDFTASPSLTVTYGKDMIAFKGDLQTDDQINEIEAVAWDSTNQILMKAKGEFPPLNKQGTLSSKELAEIVGNKNSLLQTITVAEELELKNWANSFLLKAGLSRVNGEVQFQGNADIKVGTMLKLAGLSKRFNGNAFVGMVEHEIKDGVWLTTAGIGVKNDNAANNSKNLTSIETRLLPEIQGLHVGKIIKVNEDPMKENRLQVEIPLLNGIINTVWARMSTFWASNGYGALFIPDIGDEVVLGFFNNDPCYPVILGSMYSSKQTTSAKIEQKNTIRSIVTKSKLKLEFEEEKKNITLTTPDNNKIEISDEGKSIKIIDQNNNKIQMTKDGILIDSSKGITLKAKTEIKIEAGTNIVIEGKSAVNLKGANIEAKADATFTAKGNAKAELSATGQTVVKGTMVMIN